MTSRPVALGSQDLLAARGSVVTIAPVKKLLVLVVVAGLGVGAYLKWVRKAPAARACEQVTRLCGELTANTCADLAKVTNDKAVTCVMSADSCMEAMGCFMGSALQDFERGFERGSE